MANISLGNTLTTGLVFTSDTTGNLVVTSTGGYIDLSNSTGGMVLPVGNTDQRPATVANGTLRYNTTTSAVEGYVAGAWGSIGGAGGGPTWANIQTGNFTASAGNAYPVNTTSNPIWVTLPSSPGAGNVIILTDYKQTFGANAVTINPNGSNIYGVSSNVLLNTSGESVNLVYIDSTQGWLCYSGFINNPVGPYAIDLLLVAGGGGGAAGYGGGGGGGGGAVIATLQVAPGTGYSIIIGAGGAGYPGYNNSPQSWTANHGANGTPSSGFTNTAIGGGGGGGAETAGYNGGSGGGGGGAPTFSGGSGTFGQGNAGGASASAPNYGAGGGGGAGAVGGNGSSTTGGTGGAGVNWQSLGSYYAGGGGGGTYNVGTAGGGGIGGGGAGSNSSAAGTSGTTNTGGGGGGGNGQTPGPNAQGGGGGGGSGIAIIRYVGGQRGSGGTIVSSGGYTYHTFTSSSTYTA